jgi:hypothetical protein
MAEPVTVLLLVACTAAIIFPVSYLAASAFDNRPVVYTRYSPASTVVYTRGFDATGEELLLVPVSALGKADDASS